MNALTRLYCRLSPDERFKLHLQATARGDLEEARRLRDTCPLQAYRTWDPAFADPLATSRLLVITVAADLEQRLARLETLASVLKLTRGLASLASERTEAREALECLCEALDEACEGPAIEVRAYWDAFCQFCSVTLGMEAKTVAAAWYPPLVERISRLPDLKTDSEATALSERVITLLGETWSREVPGPR